MLIDQHTSCNLTHYQANSATGYLQTPAWEAGFLILKVIFSQTFDSKFSLPASYQNTTPRTIWPEMAASNLLATLYVLLATCTSYIAFVTYQHRLKIHKLRKQGYVSFTRWFLVVFRADFYFASLAHLDGVGSPVTC